MSLNKKNTILKKYYESKLSTKVGIQSLSSYRGTMLGFELEVENIVQDPTGLASIGITAEGDGSLRNNGREFVFTNPLNLEESEKAIRALCEKLPKDASFSNRTSVHVHLNASDITVKEYHQFLTLWYLVEALLVRRSGGKDREGNMFCLRGLDSNSLIDNYKKAFRGNNRLLVSTERYNCLNTRAFSKFGSLEIRSHRGTSDADELVKWAKVLAEVFEKSKTFSNARDILFETSQKGAEGFLREKLPLLWSYINEKPSEDLTLGDDFFDYYDEGIALAQDIAYCVEVVDPPEPEKDKKSSISEMAFSRGYVNTAIRDARAQATPIAGRRPRPVRTVQAGALRGLGELI